MEAVIHGGVEIDAHEGGFVHYGERGNEGTCFYSDWDDLSMKDQATIIELRGEAMSAMRKLGEFLKSLGEDVALAA
jgi:hypothetical protein